jgi:hypothetical protein
MRVSLAGLGAEIVVAGDRLGDILLPALRHLPPAVDTDVRVHVWDGVSGELPPPPWDERDVIARGEIAGLGPSMSAAVTTSTFSFFDRASRQAFFWVPDGRTIPWWERAAPFRTIFSWWQEDHGRHFVHSAAVGVDGSAVLLAGPGGSGKSTTSIACLVDGLDFFGGDYVVMRPGTAPSVHSVYSSAKLDERSLDLIPSLKPLVATPAARDADKSIIYLQEAFGNRLAADADLTAILLPKIADSTSVTPATPAESLRLLAPSSIFQLPSAGEDAFRAIGSLVRTIPSFRLQVGPDPADAVKVISSFFSVK